MHFATGYANFSITLALWMNEAVDCGIWKNEPGGGHNMGDGAARHLGQIRKTPEWSFMFAGGAGTLNTGASCAMYGGLAGISPHLVAETT
ncbi:hypothetical protein Zmor_026063 [Zophobas morio]|uniref:Uncharacterized protein n=1 Tax=Zophobas morio TaxID=2755281 RepID=A0AA38HST2_9CUCU|nr:hypothetical protein Zmor_026063 [Zophobas morio]